jgi:carboxypeptidase Taq
VRECKRNLSRKALPGAVVAKQGNDFDLFAKAFAVLMPLNREIAAAKVEALGLAPYDALMDEADPGLTAAIVDSIFDDLASALPILLAEVVERQASWLAPIPFSGDSSAERQRALSYNP